jgi:ABC-2 type transport system ATP-binding protein
LHAAAGTLILLGHHSGRVSEILIVTINPTSVPKLHSSPITIAVHALTKQFPLKRSLSEIIRHPLRHEWVTVLDGIDLTVTQGEVLGVLGPNGAGKTTLMKILCTLLLPSAGTAIVHGYDVERTPLRVRQAVGYCLNTERSFYYRLSGVQNLAFFATLNNLPTQEVNSRIAEVLNIVGLTAAADSAFMTYSKGMQQRLGLARALLTDPAVLLLDEPTNGLDPGAATEFRQFLRNKLADELGKTVLLVTHSLEEAHECCDRMAIMDQGKLVFEGDWSALQTYLCNYGFPGQETKHR